MLDGWMRRSIESKDYMERNYGMNKMFLVYEGRTESNKQQFFVKKFLFFEKTNISSYFTDFPYFST